MSILVRFSKIDKLGNSRHGADGRRTGQGQRTVFANLFGNSLTQRGPSDHPSPIDTPLTIPPHRASHSRVTHRTHLTRQRATVGPRSGVLSRVLIVVDSLTQRAPSLTEHPSPIPPAPPISPLTSLTPTSRSPREPTAVRRARPLRDRHLRPPPWRDRACDRGLHRFHLFRAQCDTFGAIYRLLPRIHPHHSLKHATQL